METYKKQSVRQITYQKYETAYDWLVKLVPDLELETMKRFDYQTLINEYAKTHEKGTVKNFHTELKASLFDAVEDELIRKNPAVKITITGKKPRDKLKKYLSKAEAEKLLSALHPTGHIDSAIFLGLKTGMRFEEILGIKKEDIDFENETISINKSYDYKITRAAAPTKNYSSIRTIDLDKGTLEVLKQITEKLNDDDWVFVGDVKPYSTTYNDRLRVLCKRLDIPQISMHGLRHTHASLLLNADVSLASIAKRLGHSDSTITQKVYVHVIDEMADKDRAKIKEVI